MPKIKQILAIAFEGNRPAQGAALYDGESLYVRSLNEVNEDKYVFAEAIKQVIEEKSSEGWVVMVEDRTFSFPGRAVSWDFDATGPDGKINLHSCLDWYFSLSSRGQIAFEDQAKRHEIRLGGMTDWISRKHNERGQSLYSVDWTQFTGCHRALLMCVAGAVMEEPLSDRWMKAFLGHKRELKGPPVWPVFRAMRKMWKSRQEELEMEIERLEARKDNAQR